MFNFSKQVGLRLSTSRSRRAWIFFNARSPAAQLPSLPPTPQACRAFASKSQTSSTSRASLKLGYYSPWSKDFSGSLRIRILLQSVFYAACIVGVTEVVNSYISVRIMTWNPRASTASTAYILKGFKQSSISQERHDGDKRPRYASQREVRLAIDELRQAFPSVNSVTTDPDALRTYGFSENSYHPASPHSVVVMSTFLLATRPLSFQKGSTQAD